MNDSRSHQLFGRAAETCSLGAAERQRWVRVSRAVTGAGLAAPEQVPADRPTDAQTVVSESGAPPPSGAFLSHGPGLSFPGTWRASER